MTDTVVVLLHLCDSLFPIGSFAHSDGLEAATSCGEIQTATDLRAWMEVTLFEQLRRVEGPALARASRAAAPPELDVLTAIDDEVYAIRPTSTGRESTRAMGGRLLKTWQQIRPHRFIQSLLDRRAQVTLPVAFGVVAAVSEIPVSSAVEGFFYTRLAATVSAAMRLMPLGQHDAHTLLALMLSQVPEVAAAACADDGPLISFTPVLDVTVMKQQYVESRLFKS
jgi:urease accessory protein